MQFPIIIGLRPSVRGGILLGHLSRLWPSPHREPRPSFWCALMVLACLSGYRAWIAFAGPHPSRLCLLADGRIDVEVGEGSWQHAGDDRFAAHSSLVDAGPSALGGWVADAVIAPDAINGEDFSPPRVWLRWRKSP